MRTSMSASSRRSPAVAGALAVGVWLALVLAGCGAPSPTTPDATTAPESATLSPTSGGETATAAPTGTPTPAPPTPAPPTPTATPSPEAESLLKRRDAPPGGVAATFEYVIEGNGVPCIGLDPTTPAVYVDGPIPEIATTYYLCVMGLTGDQPIGVSIALPDGSVRSYTADRLEPGVALLALTALPGDPVGDYVATATQDGAEAIGSYTVSRASVPRVRPVPPGAAPPGSTFRLALAGFAPASEVGLDLYRNTEVATWTYLTSLPPIVTDAAGEAIYDLQTAPDDAQATYCVVYRVAAEAPHAHCDAIFVVAF